MDVERLKLGEEFSLWVRLLAPGTLHEGCVDLRMDAQREGRCTLGQGNNLVPAEVLPQSAGDAAAAAVRIERGAALYAAIVSPVSTQTVEVRLSFLTEPVVTMSDFAVVVPHQLYADTNVKKPSGMSWPAYLRQELTLPDAAGTDGFFLFTLGRGQEMTLVGEHLYLKVERQEKNGMPCLWGIELKRHAQKLPPTLRLARGRLLVYDEAQATSFQADNAAVQYERLAADAQHGTYIEQWNRYGELEGDILLDRARKVGVLHFTRAEPVKDGGKETRFFLRETPPDLLRTFNKKREGFCLVPEDHLPPYLLAGGEDVTWDLYEEIERETRAAKKKQVAEHPFVLAHEDASVSYQKWKEQHPQWGAGAKEERYPYLPFVRYEEQQAALILEGYDDYPAGCVLIYDINGKRVSLERKANARRYIRDGEKAGMPQLRFLLEGARDQMTPPPRVPHIRAITPFVQEKVFGAHPPTDTQAKAVDVALNTPDIALIQGPPGTGKTTVISAIVERLNEEADRKGSKSGQVLVSAFQHDAVENVIQKLSVNAMPTYKFGKRGDDEEHRDINETFDQWVGDLRSRLAAKYPELGVSEAVMRVEQSYSNYVRQPGRLQRENLLADLTRLMGELSPSLGRELSALCRSYALSSAPADSSGRERLGIVRALRVRGGAATDDDAARLADFYAAFQGDVTEKEKKLIEACLKTQDAWTDAQYRKLRRLKEKYLGLSMERPQYQRPKIDQHLDDICQRALKELKRARRAKNQKQELLASFALNLAEDPVGVRDSLIADNYVFGATVQQSDGTDIRWAKLAERNAPVYFETVIVDEAARSSPLDLLIPMAGAQRRIVLVGDQKQLPHIVDEEVCKRMDAGADTQSVDEIRGQYEKSLFEHLFDLMKNLEEKDHIVRTVTLDQQFRMHPLLGHFVSDAFYESALQSPIPADAPGFQQALPGLGGRPALWLDVPFDAGDEGRDGTSRFRAAEAKAAARLLHQWMDSEAGQDLTFGVISFYKAQKDAVYEALCEEGMASYDSSWQIKEPYDALTNGAERLRIGTVDAFQGMEFDVVLLMMVRTRELPLRLGKNERDYNRVFGHLRSKNRLCVSMSRGKRVLAVIGDKALAQSPEARTKSSEDGGPDLGIPELAAFADLCDADGVVMSAMEGAFAVE